MTIKCRCILFTIVRIYEVMWKSIPITRQSEELTFMEFAFNAI